MRSPDLQTGRFRSSEGLGSSSWSWSPVCAFCQAVSRFWQRGPRCQRSPWPGGPVPWVLWQWEWCSENCSLYWTGSDPASHWWALRRRHPPNLETAVEGGRKCIQISMKKNSTCTHTRERFKPRARQAQRPWRSEAVTGDFRSFEHFCHGVRKPSLRGSNWYDIKKTERV